MELLALFSNILNLGQKFQIQVISGVAPGDVEVCRLVEGLLQSATDANISDHNRVQLSSLENQLCTSVVNNSNSGQSLNLLEKSQEACGDHTEVTSVVGIVYVGERCTCYKGLT